MSWFYIKKGDFRNRGVVSEKQLGILIRAGEINRNDLLWNDKEPGRWVRAESLSNHFDNGEEPAPEIKPQLNKPRVSPKPLPLKNRRKSLWLPAMAAAAAAVLIVAGHLIQKTDDVPQVEAAVEPPPPAETNIWETVVSDFTTLLAQNKTAEARALMSGYEADRGKDNIYATMDLTLTTFLKKQRLSQLYSDFLNGKASHSSINEILQVASDLSETENLTESLKTLLSSKKKPSAVLCQSILVLAVTKNDQALINMTASVIEETIDWKASPDDCMKIVLIYNKNGLDSRSITLIRKYIEHDSEEPWIWLELSALLAQADQTDEALNALKMAVKHGGDDIRQSARNDPRFEPVRETWSFGRLTR